LNCSAGFSGPMNPFSQAFHYPFGASYYRDRLVPTGLPHINQSILSVHAVYTTADWELLNEGVLIRNKADGQNLVVNTPGFYSQISRRCNVAYRRAERTAEMDEIRKVVNDYLTLPHPLPPVTPRIRFAARLGIKRALLAFPTVPDVLISGSWPRLIRASPVLNGQASAMTICCRCRAAALPASPQRAQRRRKCQPESSLLMTT